MAPSNEESFRYQRTLSVWLKFIKIYVNSQYTQDISTNSLSSGYSSLPKINIPWNDNPGSLLDLSIGIMEHESDRLQEKYGFSDPEGKNSIYSLESRKQMDAALCASDPLSCFGGSGAKLLKSLLEKSLKPFIKYDETNLANSDQRQDNIGASSLYDGNLELTKTLYGYANENSYLGYPTPAFGAEVNKAGQFQEIKLETPSLLETLGLPDMHKENSNFYEFGNSGVNIKDSYRLNVFDKDLSDLSYDTGTSNSISVGSYFNGVNSNPLFTYSLLQGANYNVSIGGNSATGSPNFISYNSGSGMEGGLGFLTPMGGLGLFLSFVFFF